jgi:molybdenum cofactor cytidylyltransferase
VASIGIILLAAGASTRLGQPKQLLAWRGRTLLRHLAQTALSAGLGPVVAVLGAAEAECRQTLADSPIRITVNSSWREGMGGSIATGMTAFLDDALEGVIIMLCDQPAVTEATLRALRDEQQKTGAAIVASRYAGALGPPALFMASCFRALAQLRGHEGARSLFAEERALSSIDFPDGALDIDTPSDLRRLGAE